MAQCGNNWIIKMDELYKQYGELLIKLEILNSEIREVKKKIIEELNKQGQKDD